MQTSEIEKEAPPAEKQRLSCVACGSSEMEKESGWLYCRSCSWGELL